MKNRGRLLLVVAIVILLPYLITWGLGSYWLFQRGYLLLSLGVTAAFTIVGWQVVKRMAQACKPESYQPPSDKWSPAGNAAWQEIEKLRHEVETAPAPPVESFEQVSEHLMPLMQQAFETVAKKFHPDSSQPALEVTAPQVLRCGELVLRDLRLAIEEQFPAAHLLKIKHFGHFINTGKTAQEAYPLYQAAAAVINPLAGGLRYLASKAMSKTTDVVIISVVPWALGFVVKQTGYYAIQLYSGQLDLGERQYANLGQDKPLRVLILGQTKAGKSSLINAIFKQTIAKTDVIPCTSSITPYELNTRADLPKTILLDAVGFGGDWTKSEQKALDKELAQCDLVLAVCSANSAAREADRKLISDARQRLATLTQRAVPPTLVVLTHIDKLRPFTEWNPPYDFAVGTSTKETNVRDAIQAVSDDLQIPKHEVVPVCLRPDAVYNVDEQLVSTMATVLPDADRAKFLRIWGDTRSAEEQEKTKQQLVRLGLAAAELGIKAAGQYVTGGGVASTGIRVVTSLLQSSDKSPPTPKN
ncbi:MAG: GTPase [Planctomycetota bacterium]|nr:GTPase [Planctomycetota bacterium]